MLQFKTYLTIVVTMMLEKLRLHCYRHNFTVQASIVYCLWVRPGAYSRVEYLKGLPGTNALAYS
jgi:hypothetical protein